MAYFQSIATAAGSGYPSVYTSTYGPSFGPGKFIYGTTFAGDGTAYQTHAVIEQLPVSQKFTVNTYIYPQTNTTSSTYVSSTGILTLHFASAPIDTSGAVGLPITVDGYSGPNVGLNGTWPITSIAASGLTVNVQATIGLGALTLSGGVLDAGNPYALVTAGPRAPRPGDVLWSDAFWLGDMIATVSGTGFPYVVDVAEATQSLFEMMPHTAHGSASPGQWWALPAAVKRDQQASTKDLYITQWPIGLEKSCTSKASQPQGAGMNCTTKQGHGQLLH